jgi:hypothetical protein
LKVQIFFTSCYSKIFNFDSFKFLTVKVVKIFSEIKLKFIWITVINWVIDNWFGFEPGLKKNDQLEWIVEGALVYVCLFVF